MPGQVVLVEPLHDDDERARLRVVQSRLERVLEKVYAGFPLHFAVRHQWVLGVVNDDHIAALACQCAAYRCGEHEALVGVLEFVLPVDVIFQLDHVPPVLLEPRAFDDVPGEDVVLAAQAVAVAYLDEPLLRVLDPRPYRVAHGRFKGFHVSRRHIDHQPPDLPPVDCFHVFPDQVDVPVVNVGYPRLDDVPRLFDECRECPFCLFAGYVCQKPSCRLFVTQQPA